MAVITTKKFDEYLIPDIVPEPSFSDASDTPVISLNSEWSVSDGKTALTVIVPHDMNVDFLKGFGTVYDYNRTVSLPRRKEGSRLVLVFEGVNGFADLYVNGNFVRHHENGLLTWNTDITEEAGNEDLQLHLHVDETLDDVSTFSHGGILRPAYLYLLPETYIASVYLTPIIAEDYRHAGLRMEISANREDQFDLQISIEDPSGNTVMDRVYPGERHQVLEENIPDPVLWDAEHPDLYTVSIRILKNGRVLEETKKKTGLRKIEKRGNRLYLNGRVLKLHGVCRHEITALDGRATTHEQILEDVKLFKEANINYIRTSHYPPNRYLLDLCDEYGIYVEDELALAFIARTLPYTQEDPALTDRYISHFTECCARDYNHPSVIIWSLCNESFGGYNFDLLNRYVHYRDPSRVTKFSYPMTVREEHEAPDIWSIHYSEYTMDLGEKRDNVSVGGAFGKDCPVIHDEYCHVPCYNREELRRDPYVRIFWGQGLARMWEKIFHTDGALGGAIWAGLDDTDMYLGGSSQLEWGIIDVWRRKKPEFYMVRKAYSPVNILSRGRTILLENRFCHTDFSEVTMKYTCGTKTGEMRLPAAAPGQIVPVKLPAEKDGSVFVQFRDSRGNCVNEDLIPAQGMEAPFLPEPDLVPGEKISVRDTGNGIYLSNNIFSAQIGEDGLLEKLCNADGRKVLGHGPDIHVPYFRLGEWGKTRTEVSYENHAVLIRTVGTYKDSLELEWRLLFAEDGVLDVSYTVTKVAGKLPKNIKLRVGVDCGGLDELGVAFDAPEGCDTFSYALKYSDGDEGCYDWAPEGTMTCLLQSVSSEDAVPHEFGSRPLCSFEEDANDDILNGKYASRLEGSNLFRATKENVNRGYFYRKGDSFGLEVAGGSCRNIRIDPYDPESMKVYCTDPGIKYSGTWYRTLDPKNPDTVMEYCSRESGASFEYTFTGCGIIWYAPQDTVCGLASVYIDGKCVDERISQRVPGVDFPCSSVGYDRKYHMASYSVDQLEYGTHTLKVVVQGKGAPDSEDTYIILDYLRVIDKKRTQPLHIYFNQAFSYPHISWGNYRKEKISLESGTKGNVILKPVVFLESIYDLMRANEELYRKQQEMNRT